MEMMNGQPQQVYPPQANQPFPPPATSQFAVPGQRHPAPMQPFSYPMSSAGFPPAPGNVTENVHHCQLHASYFMQSCKIHSVPTPTVLCCAVVWERFSVAHCVYCFLSSLLAYHLKQML